MLAACDDGSMSIRESQCRLSRSSSGMTQRLRSIAPDLGLVDVPVSAELPGPDPAVQDLASDGGRCQSKEHGCFAYGHAHNLHACA